MLTIYIQLLTLFCFLSQCCIAQYWDSLYGGINRSGTCLYADTLTDKLYVGGTFTLVNHDTIWGIASWNGNQWDSLDQGIDYLIGNMPKNTWAITRYGNYLFVGGGFDKAGAINTPRMARWDGTNWDSIPGGQPNGVVKDIKTYNNELYICGTFNTVGTIPAMELAKWNGISWQAIGPNFNFGTGILSKIIFFNGNLYVAGTFDDPSGNFCRLAKWNGTNWQFFTSDIVGGLAGIWDMEVYNNELYVGGLFYSSDGNNATSIMRWNDTTWQDVGGSIEVGGINPFPTIKDMCIHNGKLYCGGNFEKVGGITTNGIASWDGTNWCGYNIGFSGLIETIAFFHDTLYVSGGFVALDNDSAYYIAKWIGGNIPDTCGNTTEVEENYLQESLSIYPNPTQRTFWIHGNINAKEMITVEVFDLLGQRTYSETLPPSSYLREEILLNNYSNGVYLVHVRSGDRIFSQKIVIQR